MVSVPKNRFSAWSLLFHSTLVCLAVFHVAITVSHYLSNQFFTDDVGHIDYLFYNTYHGRFFWSIVCDVPHFSIHFTPTLVLLVPFHALFQHVLFIPIAEDLAVASGAWAIAWMTRGFLRRQAIVSTLMRWDLAMGLLYLANVHTGSIFFAHHFESFALGLSLWALAALANQRHRLFLALLILAVGVKEDIALYWGVFGLWWILFGWQHKSDSDSSLKHSRSEMLLARILQNSEFRKRLILGGGIFILCVIWAVSAIYTIQSISLAYGQPVSEFAGRYNWMGETSIQRARTVLTTPRYIIAPLSNMAYLLLPGILFLSLLAPASLLLLVPGAYVMGLSRIDSQFALYYYYSYPFLPFLFLGASLGLARMLSWVQRRQRYAPVLKKAVFTVLLISAISFLFSPTRTDHKRRWPEMPTERHHWIRQVLREKIPPKASVAAQADLLPQISHREAMYPLSKANLERAEYWVFDTQGFLGAVSADQAQEMVSEGFRLAKMKKVEIILNAYGVLIFRKI